MNIKRKLLGKTLFCCLLALQAAFTAAACGVMPNTIEANRSLSYSAVSSEELDLNPSSLNCEDSSAYDSSSLSSGQDSENSSQVWAMNEEAVLGEQSGGTDTDSQQEGIYNPYITADWGSPAYAVVPNDASVKYLGRTELLSDALWCAMSGTGAEFEYTGKNLEITFCGDSSVSDVYGHRARVGIFVNGERVVDEIISNSQKTVSVIKSQESSSYTVRIVKLSEALMSSVGIRSINIDEGESIAPTEQKSRKIEFIGDSITCGYGIDDTNPKNSFSTSTEDITKTYAHLSAQYLDADYSVFALSGYGVLSGYTSNSSQINTQALIPSYYPYIGYSSSTFSGGTLMQSVSWDFSRFQPDVIVINLGTNDSTYCKTDEKLAEFVEAYVNFLYEVRTCNPNAEIFCILGTCSQQIWQQVEQAANRYADESSDEKIHSILIDSGDSSYGYGASYHPSAASNALMGQVLYEQIAMIMDW